MTGHQPGFWRNPWHNRSVAIAYRQQIVRERRWADFKYNVWVAAWFLMALVGGLVAGRLIVGFIKHG